MCGTNAVCRLAFFLSQQGRVLPDFGGKRSGKSYMCVSCVCVLGKKIKKYMFTFESRSCEGYYSLLWPGTWPGGQLKQRTTSFFPISKHRRHFSLDTNAFKVGGLTVESLSDLYLLCHLFRPKQQRQTKGAFFGLHLPSTLCVLTPPASNRKEKNNILWMGCPEHAAQPRD